MFKKLSKHINKLYNQVYDQAPEVITLKKSNIRVYKDKDNGTYGLVIGNSGWEINLLIDEKTYDTILETERSL
jgi:hypothetical protein